jgi:hypothetical protein
MPATLDDAPFWEALHTVAQASEPEVRDAMLATIRQLRAAIDLDQVEALVNGALGADWASGRIMQGMGLDRIIYDTLSGLDPEWERIAVGVGESSASVLTNELAIPEINMNAFFQRVPAMTRAHAGTLITNVTRDQLEAIRDVLAENWQRTPAQLARALKDVVGLDGRQAPALERYRLSLEVKKTPKAKIQKLVNAERKRMTTIRANRIGRTEPVSMANRAQLELWQVEKEAGHLSGIDLKKMFSGLAGDLPYPPAHPNCLCAVQIIQLEDRRFARRWIRVPVQQPCPICDSYDGQII